MMTFIDHHPTLFALLAFPVVCTVCLLAIMGFIAAATRD